MKKLTKTKIRGFTIIELLVVMTIIGILATIAAVSVQPIQKRSRDASRKSDLATMRTGLEVFHSQFKIYPNNTMYLGVNGDGGAQNSNYDLASSIVECSALANASPQEQGSWPGFATNSQDLNNSFLKEGFRAVNGFLICLKTLEQSLRDPQFGAIGGVEDYHYRVSYDYSSFILSTKLENEKDSSLETLFVANPGSKRYIIGNGKSVRQLADDSKTFYNLGGSLDDGFYLYQCLKNSEGSVISLDDRASEAYNPIIFSGDTWAPNSACGVGGDSIRIIQSFGIGGTASLPTVEPSP